MIKSVSLACGGGGAEMNALINDVIFKCFDNEILRQSNDGALLDFGSKKLVFTTDSFVVNPIFFAGGDIGKIAACGSINDIAMMGAKPLYLSCALIIEEGFELANLERILCSLASVAKDAGLCVVCGDTKVVPKGACDGIFINTSAIGKLIDESLPASTKRLKSASPEKKIKILLSGDIGRHGAALLASRHGLQSLLSSDCAALNAVVESLYNAGVRPLAMRDATRGGLSAVLHEWARVRGGIEVCEEKVAVSAEVMGVCELLGFEAYELANEGTFVLAVSEDESQIALKVLKEFNLAAQIIGEFCTDFKGVRLKNIYGSKRFLDEPKGELLPRIC